MTKEQKEKLVKMFLRDTKSKAEHFNCIKQIHLGLGLILEGIFFSHIFHIKKGF